MSDNKIVFVNRFFYPDISATSQMLSDLAFDLAKSGKTVEIVTSRLLFDDAEALLPAYDVIDGVSVYRVWTSRFGRGKLLGRAVDYLTFYATAAWRLWQRTDEDTYLVVKTDPPLISIVAAPIAHLRGAKLINWLQDLFPEVAAALDVKFMRWPVLNVLRYLRNSSLRTAHRNVAIGQLMKQRLLEQGVPSERITVVPNWADGDLIKPIPHEENPLRQEWGLLDKFVVGYSGNLGRAHEFDTILDAAETLKRNQYIVFLFVGAGAQYLALEKEVFSRGLTNIMFRPYQPRELLSQSLSAIDVHLISLNPALEGFIVPSKFYGIAAVGRPSIFIGNTTGEIPLLLNEYKCGYSVNSGEVVELRSMITEFAKKPGVCFSRGGAARKMFTGKYDKSTSTREFKKLII